MTALGQESVVAILSHAAAKAARFSEQNQKVLESLSAKLEDEPIDEELLENVDRIVKDRCFPEVRESDASLRLRVLARVIAMANGHVGIARGSQSTKETEELVDTAALLLRSGIKLTEQLFVMDWILQGEERQDYVLFDQIELLLKKLYAVLTNLSSSTPHVSYGERKSDELRELIKKCPFTSAPELITEEDNLENEEQELVVMYSLDEYQNDCVKPNEDDREVKNESL